jgi:hypothetical protein
MAAMAAMTAAQPGSASRSDITDARCRREEREVERRTDGRYLAHAPPVERLLRSLLPPLIDTHPGLAWHDLLCRVV